MKQIAQNYKSGHLSLLEVPVPACKAGGVLVRTAFSLVSTGTEMMKIQESKLSLAGKARARPDQVKKVLESVAQQGTMATYRKVMNRLDKYTPLGYSLAGVVVEVGAGVDDFSVGQRVACGGNLYALHAEFNWVPKNLCVPVPDCVATEHAAFATVGAIAMQGFRQSRASLGETACVIGLGLIGQLLVQILRAAGVQVVGVDIAEGRCRMAERHGAAATGVPGTNSLAAMTARLSELTGGAGADHVFLTAGGKSNQPVELAADLARDRARIVDIGKCKLDLPWNAYYEKELDVRFSRSYGPGRYDQTYEEDGIDYPIGYVRWTERRNMQCFIDLVGERRIDLSALSDCQFDFDKAVETYERVNSGDFQELGILFRYPKDAALERRLGSVSTSPGRMRSSRADSPLSTVRLGVIGSGNYATSMLLPHLIDRNDVELVEVATATALSARNAQEKFGFSRISTDYRGILADSDIDAVMVLTRHSSHALIVCEALRAGKAVFVEKPLAVDGDQLEAIRAAVEDTDNDRLMVGFNRRFAPLLVKLKASWGRVAGPLTIRYQVNAGPLEAASWYAQRATEGSRFVGEGCHFVDTVSWWLGEEPTEVSAISTSDDPDNMMVGLRYPGGSMATIAYMTGGDPKYPKEIIEVFGNGRVAKLDNFQSTELWQNGRRRTNRSLRGVDKGQKSEMDAFVQAVRQGGSFPTSVASLLSTTEATFAAVRSAASGRVEPVGRIGGQGDHEILDDMHLGTGE